MDDYDYEISFDFQRKIITSCVFLQFLTFHLILYQLNASQIN